MASRQVLQIPEQSRRRRFVKARVRVHADPDGTRRVYLPPCSSELPPAETFWLVVAEPIVNKAVPSSEHLVETIGARCCALAERRTEVSARTSFVWRPRNHTPRRSGASCLIR